MARPVNSGRASEGSSHLTQSHIRTFFAPPVPQFVTNLSGGVFVAVCVASSPPAGAEESPGGIDGAALLLALREQRAGLSGANVEFLRSAEADGTGDTIRYNFRFDGQKRAFAHGGGPPLPLGPTRASFDGNRAFVFDGSGVVIDLLGTFYMGPLFDMRLLGASAGLHAVDTLDAVLPSGRPVQVLGTERIGDVDVVHLRTSNESDEIFDFWVEPSEALRVHRAEWRTRDGLWRRSATSSFGKVPGLPAQMPSRVEEIGGRSDAEQTRTITELVSWTPAGGRNDDFGLSAVDPPAGTPVADLQLKQRIGYWNGSGLSEEVVAADIVAAEAETAREVALEEADDQLPVWYFVAAAAILALLGAGAYRVLQAERAA